MCMRAHQTANVLTLKTPEHLFLRQHFIKFVLHMVVCGLLPFQPVHAYVHNLLQVLSGEHRYLAAAKYTKWRCLYWIDCLRYFYAFNLGISLLAEDNFSNCERILIELSVKLRLLCQEIR